MTDAGGKLGCVLSWEPKGGGVCSRGSGQCTGCSEESGAWAGGGLDLSFSVGGGHDAN